MKKIVFLTFLIFFSCSESSKTTEQSGNLLSDEDKIPVLIQAIRNDPGSSKATLSIQANSGFGIQIDAPNQLQAEGVDGLKLVSSDFSFRGKPKSDKPEYYEIIQPMELVVEGEGSLHLTGKLFYCDYSKNICLPGKISRTLKL